jgi:hypothetical protein
MRIQRLVIVFTVTFAITLALVVGQRLSTEAMAVMVGVVAGVVASIPTSLIVVWIARRALSAPPGNGPSPDSRLESPERDTKIIVVPASATPYPAGSSYLPSRPPLAQYAPAPPPRQFTIIGGEASEDSLLPWR